MAFENDYTLAKGKVYFDVFDSAGALTGRRFLGDCPGFTVTISSENLEHFASTGGIKEKDLEVLIQVDRKANIVCDNVSMQNIELFLVGDLVDVVEAVTAVADELITVLQDRSYQLGLSASAPTGVRNVDTVVVTNVGAVTTYIEDTDYIVDLALGTIEIVSTADGGSIAVGVAEILEIDYNTTVNTREQVATSTKAIKGALSYVADNPQGANKDLYAPSVILAPSGDLSLVGEELSQVSFDVGFNKKDSATAAIYIDGRGV